MRAHAWISHKLNAEHNHVRIQSTEITMLSVLETSRIPMVNSDACLVDTSDSEIHAGLLHCIGGCKARRALPCARTEDII